MDKHSTPFIYVIKLIPRLTIEENWTKEDEEIVNQHFTYLKALLAEGKLILAGKTDGLSDKTFGIVIFEAKSMEEANQIMSHDPAIEKGVMMGELFPYRIALRKDYSQDKHIH